MGPRPVVGRPTPFASPVVPAPPAAVGTTGDAMADALAAQAAADAAAAAAVGLPRELEERDEQYTVAELDDDAQAAVEDVTFEEERAAAWGARAIDGGDAEREQPAAAPPPADSAALATAAAHGPAVQPDRAEAAAALLESLAGRLRRGELPAPEAAAPGDESLVLAQLLAALLAAARGAPRPLPPSSTGTER